MKKLLAASYVATMNKAPNFPNYLYIRILPNPAEVGHDKITCFKELLLWLCWNKDISKVHKKVFMGKGPA